MSQHQLEETHRQLGISENNLQDTAALNEKFGSLLDKWEKQTAQIDALLTRWQHIADLEEEKLRPGH